MKDDSFKRYLLLAEFIDDNWESNVVKSEKLPLISYVKLSIWFLMV